jgi:hypothetical protein
LALRKNVKGSRALILMIIVQMFCAAPAQAQSMNVDGKWRVEIPIGANPVATGRESSNMIGRWNVEIVFADGNKRSLRFEAQGEGKGTFLVLDPRLKVWGPAKPSEAKWAQGEGNAVTFSGPVEFPIGNVGRDAGMLECKGKFESPSLITGQVDFSPLVGDRPSKLGTFKATRAQ